MPKASCSQCSKAQEAKESSPGKIRAPKGWVRTGTGDDTLVCAKCWGTRYATRTISVPVSGPVGLEWPDLRKLWRQASQDARVLANWAYRHLVSIEPPKTPEGKLGKYPKVYLYGNATASGPGWGTLGAAVGSQVLRQVEADYRADRYEMYVLGTRSTRCYGRGIPIHVAAQGIRLTEEEGRIYVSLPVGGQRVQLRLSGSHRHRRQVMRLRRLIAQPLLIGSAKLYERKKPGGEATDGQQGRENGGGARYKTELIVGISGEEERRGADNREGTLHVRTDKDSLLIALTPDGDKVWYYHADHVKRLLMMHDRHLGRLQRMSDDRKMERRRPRRFGADFASNVQAQCKRDRDRTRSAIQQVAAHFVAYAVRQRVDLIVFDDTDRSFGGSVPWAALREAIRQGCEFRNINFECKGPEEPKNEAGAEQEVSASV